MTKEFSRIDFGVLSPADIRTISLVEVTTSELYEDNVPCQGGLRDPRFGVNSRHGRCTACGKMWSGCSGHFGHYELPTPCYHIGWMVEVLWWLRRTCHNCATVHASPVKKCTKCSQPMVKVRKMDATTLHLTLLGKNGADDDGPRGTRVALAHFGRRRAFAQYIGQGISPVLARSDGASYPSEWPCDLHPRATVKKFAAKTT